MNSVEMSPVELYKAMADDTRLKTLLLITREGELCVCELMAALGDSQPKISRHLAQLRQGRLLEDRRQGQWVFYRLHPQLPDWVEQVLETTLVANRDYLASASEGLRTMGNRPERAQACCA